MVTVPPNNYVNWVKRSLNRLLGAELVLNGTVDKEYRAAVVVFQDYEKLEPDGKVGPKTQNHLIRANILKREYLDSFRGVIRKELPGTMVGSGPMSPADHNAIRAFQKTVGPKHGGLQVDGWVGPHTEYVMNSLSVPPVPSKGTDPVFEFGDDIVTGDMNKDEVKAITWIVIGHEPSTNWLSTLNIGFMFAKTLALLAAGRPGVPTISISLVSGALSDPEQAEAETDVMKGMAYGMVDFAHRRVRSNDDLKTANVNSDTTDGFRLGYRKMQRQMNFIHMRITSPGKRTLERIRRQANKAQTLKSIYAGLFAVYRNRGALGRGHANAVRMNQRNCKFTYPKISVECGPRADLLR